MFIFRKLLMDIRSRKDLIYYYAIFDLKSNTARTFFGFLWWIIDPIIYMGMFYLLVQVILGRGGPNYGIFLFVALIPLKWTVSTMVESTTTITSKSAVLQQIYVPKIVFIVITILKNLFKFAFGVIALILFLIVYHVPFSAYMLYLIPIIVVQFVFLLAISTILAHLGVYFRDIKNMMSYIARALFYLSPVMYALDGLSETLKSALYVNPMTTFMVSYRNVLLYQQQPSWLGLLIILLVSIVVLYIGLKLLFKYDKEYAKVV